MKGWARKPTMLADTRGTILAGPRVRQLSRRTDAASVAFAPASARVPHALRTVADSCARAGRAAHAGVARAVASAVQGVLVRVVFPVPGALVPGDAGRAVRDAVGDTGGVA